MESLTQTTEIVMSLKTVGKEKQKILSISTGTWNVLLWNK